MLVILTRSSTEKDLQRVIDTAEKNNLQCSTVKADGRGVVAIQGLNDFSSQFELFTNLNGVEKIIPLSGNNGISDTNSEIARSSQSSFPRGSFRIIAGPCAIEDEGQMLSLARRLKDDGASFFRGGVFKPRTSPYTFQGLGKSGTNILKNIREKTGLQIITEALSLDHLELVHDTTDIIQIGSRNMQNTPLLKAVGKLRKPVMLKRGMAATLKEWLMAAEYICSGGNENIILCERGVRTFSDHSRFTLDLSVVPAIQSRSGFPVVVDPSHATGNRNYVAAMSRAALAAGANGLMVEVHPQPDASISDAEQAISPAQFSEIMIDLHKVAAALDINIIS